MKFLINIYDMAMSEMDDILFPNKFFPNGHDGKTICSAVAAIADRMLKKNEFDPVMLATESDTDFYDALQQFASDADHSIMVAAPGYRLQAKPDPFKLKNRHRIYDLRINSDIFHEMEKFTSHYHTVRSLIDKTTKRALSRNTIENLILSNDIVSYSVLVGFDPIMPFTPRERAFKGPIKVLGQIDIFSGMRYLPRYLYELDDTSYEIAVRLLQCAIVPIFTEDKTNEDAYQATWNNQSDDRDFEFDITRALYYIIDSITEINGIQK